MKEHIYSTDEYEVKIGDPVVDAEVKATSTSVAIPCAAIPDGKYLVSLEVNGTAVAFRDTFSFASGSCTVGDYTLAYSSYAVTVSTTSNNDVVRLKIEPVEVYVTDAMKAAVVEVSPPSPAELPAITDADNGKVLTANSGVWGAANPSGGGVLVVNFNENGTLDKTWQELLDATFSVIPMSQSDSIILLIVYYVYERVPLVGGDTEYVVKAFNHDDAVEFVASSASGYPVIHTD